MPNFDHLEEPIRELFDHGASPWRIWIAITSDGKFLSQLQDFVCQIPWVRENGYIDPDDVFQDVIHLLAHRVEIESEKPPGKRYSTKSSIGTWLRSCVRYLCRESGEIHFRLYGRKVDPNRVSMQEDREPLRRREVWLLIEELFDGVTLDVARLLAARMTNQEIADEIGLALTTVKGMRKQIVVTLSRHLSEGGGGDMGEGQQ